MVKKYFFKKVTFLGIWKIILKSTLLKGLSIFFFNTTFLEYETNIFLKRSTFLETWKNSMFKNLRFLDLEKNVIFKNLRFMNLGKNSLKVTHFLKIGKSIFYTRVPWNFEKILLKK